MGKDIIFGDITVDFYRIFYKVNAECMKGKYSRYMIASLG